MPLEQFRGYSKLKLRLFLVEIWKSFAGCGDVTPWHEAHRHGREAAVERPGVKGKPPRVPHHACGVRPYVPAQRPHALGKGRVVVRGLRHGRGAWYVVPCRPPAATNGSRCLGPPAQGTHLCAPPLESLHAEDAGNHSLGRIGDPRVGEEGQELFRHVSLREDEACGEPGPRTS